MLRSDDERKRYDILRSRVLAAVDQVTSTYHSFQLRLTESVPAQDVAEWMVLEHRRCPFLNVAITIRSDDTRWIDLGGSAPIKDFVREEFSSVIKMAV